MASKPAYKKNVVFVINTLQGNGAERIVLTLAEAMVKSGHRAEIILLKNHIELPIPDGLKVHIFPYQRLRFLPKRLRFKMSAWLLDKFITRKIGQPNLILSNLVPSDLILAHSKLPNIKFIIHNTVSKEYDLQNDPGDAAQLTHLDSIYSSKDCICVSQGVQKDFDETVKNRATSATIYNPINGYFINESSTEMTPELGTYIVNVGGFKPAKRQDILLRAFAKMQSDVDLVFIGKGQLLDNMKALAKELGIERRVHFLGFQKNPFPYIKHAKALAVSSDFEGLGMTILEAIALGTPVISTDCPSGPSEILPPNNLVQVGDIDALAEKLDAVLNEPHKFNVVLDQKFTTDYAVSKYIGVCS